MPNQKIGIYVLYCLISSVATTESVGKSFGPCEPYVQKLQHRIRMYLVILHLGTRMYLPVSHLLHTFLLASFPGFPC